MMSYSLSSRDLKELETIFTTKHPEREMLMFNLTTQESLVDYLDKSKFKNLTETDIMKLLCEYPSKASKIKQLTKNKLIHLLCDSIRGISNLDPTKKQNLNEFDIKLFVSVLYQTYSRNIRDKIKFFNFSNKTKQLLLKQKEANDINVFHMLAEQFDPTDFIKYWKINPMCLHYIAEKHITKEMLEYVLTTELSNDKYYVGTIFHRTQETGVWDMELLLKFVDKKSLSLHDWVYSGLIPTEYQGLANSYAQLVNYNKVIDKNNTFDPELISYADLVDDDPDLMREYVKSKLLKVKLTVKQVK